MLVVVVAVVLDVDVVIIHTVAWCCCGVVGGKAYVMISLALALIGGKPIGRTSCVLIID